MLLHMAWFSREGNPSVARHCLNVTLCDSNRQETVSGEMVAVHVSQTHRVWRITLKRFWLFVVGLTLFTMLRQAGKDWINKSIIVENIWHIEEVLSMLRTHVYNGIHSASRCFRYSVAKTWIGGLNEEKVKSLKRMLVRESTMYTKAVFRVSSLR